MNQAQILIVEDEALTAEDIKGHLEAAGYGVSAIVDSGEAALALLEGTRPDLVLMDIVLAGEIDGIDAAAAIRTRYHIPVVYLTAYTDKEKVDRAQATEPYGYLVKPFDDREVKTTIALALHKAAMDRRLSESRRWAHAVLGSIHDGVITTNRNGEVRYMNLAAQAMTGWNVEDARQHALDEVLSLVEASAAQRLREHLSRMHAHGGTEVLQLESSLSRKDESTLPIELTLAPITDAEGRHGGAVLAFRDVSAQRQAREQLRRHNAELEQRVALRTQALDTTIRELQAAKARAEAANEAKSRFLGNIGHELRTPLNPAIGYAQLLAADQSLSDKQHGHAREIEKACRSLLAMVDHLLELVRIGNHAHTPRRERLDPLQPARFLEVSASEEAKRRGLDFRLSLPERPLPPVLGDGERILQVLRHMLDNALKFTQRGEVVLRIEGQPAARGSYMLRYAIEDTGIGVWPEQQEYIFGEFTQADESTTRRYGGMGIGLALAKGLAEAMGGTLGIEGRDGGGSRFWFELTLPLADTGEQASEDPGPMP